MAKNIKIILEVKATYCLQGTTTRKLILGRVWPMIRNTYVVKIKFLLSFAGDFCRRRHLLPFFLWLYESSLVYDLWVVNLPILQNNIQRELMFRITKLNKLLLSKTILLHNYQTFPLKEHLHGIFDLLFFQLVLWFTSLECKLEFNDSTWYQNMWKQLLC